jgi:hypothetical protein
MPRPGATIASATLFNSVRSMVSSYMIRIVLNIIARHCEGRSDEAISGSPALLECFAALA